MKQATIAMPIFNGAFSLPEVFRYLELEQNKDRVARMILINDNSSDDSERSLDDYCNFASFNCLTIHRKENQGLAQGYNQGIEMAVSPLVITMHQEILFTDEDSFAKIMAPFDSDSANCAGYPKILHPSYIWNKCNFWQKAMLSLFVDKKIPMLSGKFDCFDVAVLRSIGIFRPEIFRTAGEDGDLRERMRRLNYTIFATGLEIKHMDNIEPNFGWKQYLKKECQIAEAQGVLLRLYGLNTVREFGEIFFRLILFFGLFIPIINIAFVILVVSFGYLYSARAFNDSSSLNQVFKLYIVNLVILPASAVYNIGGYIKQRQSV